MPPSEAAMMKMLKSLYLPLPNKTSITTAATSTATTTSSTYTPPSLPTNKKPVATVLLRLLRNLERNEYQSLLHQNSTSS